MASVIRSNTLIQNVLPGNPVVALPDRASTIDQLGIPYFLPTTGSLFTDAEGTRNPVWPDDAVDGLVAVRLMKSAGLKGYECVYAENSTFAIPLMVDQENNQIGRNWLLFDAGDFTFSDGQFFNGSAQASFALNGFSGDLPSTWTIVKFSNGILRMVTGNTETEATAYTQFPQTINPVNLNATTSGSRSIPVSILGGPVPVRTDIFTVDLANKQAAIYTDGEQVAQSTFVNPNVVFADRPTDNMMIGIHGGFAMSRRVLTQEEIGIVSEAFIRHTTIPGQW